MADILMIWPRTSFLFSDIYLIFVNIILKNIKILNIHKRLKPPKRDLYDFCNPAVTVVEINPKLIELFDLNSSLWPLRNLIFNASILWFNKSLWLTLSAYACKFNIFCISICYHVTILTFDSSQHDLQLCQISHS